MNRPLFKLGAQPQVTPIKPLINPQADAKSSDQPAAPAPFPNGPMSLGGGTPAAGPGGVDAALQQQQMGQALDEQGKLVQDGQAELQKAQQAAQQVQSELDSTKMQLQGMQQTHDLEKQQLTAQIDTVQQQGQSEAEKARGEAETIKQQAKAEIDAAKIQQKLHADAGKMQQKIQLEAQKAQKDLASAQQPEGVSPALQEQASRALKSVSRIGQGALKMAAVKPPGAAPTAGQTTPNPTTPVTAAGVGTPGAKTVPMGGPAPAVGKVPATPSQAPGGAQPVQPAQPAGASRGDQVYKPSRLDQQLTDASQKGTKLDLFNAGAEDQSRGSALLRGGANNVTGFLGINGMLVNMRKNRDVARRQEEMKGNFGLQGKSTFGADAGMTLGNAAQGAASTAGRVGNFYRQSFNFFNPFQQNSEYKANKAKLDNEWNHIGKVQDASKQRADAGWNARRAYESALENEGINYNTTLNNAAQIGGTALEAGSMALGGGIALKGGLTALRAGRGAMAAAGAAGSGGWKSVIPGVTGSLLTPGAGQVQQNVRMKQYNPAMGTNVEYEDGYAPMNWKGASFRAPRHVALMAKAAVIAATPQGSPGIAQGYGLNSVGGYFSQHPASPYRINSPVNSANEYGSPMKNFAMNWIMPLAAGVLGLNPTVKKPQLAGIQTGPGTGLDPQGAVAGMGLNQHGLAPK